jgi:hypothetical protein
MLQLSNGATPRVTVIDVSVQVRLPLPTVAARRTEVVESAVTRLLLESSTLTTGCTAKAEPAVVDVLGWVVNTSLLGAFVMLKLALMALSVPLVAVRVRLVPTLLPRQPANVDTPLVGGFGFVVQVSVPMAVAVSLRVMPVV